MRAIVGGIASALIGPARTCYEPKPDGRRLLDPTAIARHAREGVETAAPRSSTRYGNPQPQAKRSPHRWPKLSRHRSTSPLQSNSSTSVSSPNGSNFPTRRIPSSPTAPPRSQSASASQASLSQLKLFEIEPSSRDGQTIEVDRVLYEATVQSGEWLLVELAAGTADYTCIPADSLRFAATLTGPPARWIGAHTPAPTQKWRLWYRVESTS